MLALLPGLRRRYLHENADGAKVGEPLAACRAGAASLGSGDRMKLRAILMDPEVPTKANDLAVKGRHGYCSLPPARVSTCDRVR
jgi:hypothetical protein